MSPKLPEFEEELQAIENNLIQNQATHHGEEADSTGASDLARGLSRQRRSLERHDEHESKRAQFLSYAVHRRNIGSKEVDGAGAAETLLAHSDRYRSKVEGQLLRDLGSTVAEKYGPERAWRADLRVTRCNTSYFAQRLNRGRLNKSKHRSQIIKPLSTNSQT